MRKDSKGTCHYLGPTQRRAPRPLGSNAGQGARGQDSVAGNQGAPVGHREWKEANDFDRGELQDVGRANRRRGQRRCQVGKSTSRKGWLSDCGSKFSFRFPTDRSKTSLRGSWKSLEVVSPRSPRFINAASHLDPSDLRPTLLRKTMAGNDRWEFDQDYHRRPPSAGDQNPSRGRGTCRCRRFGLGSNPTPRLGTTGARCVLRPKCPLWRKQKLWLSRDHRRRARALLGGRSPQDSFRACKCRRTCNSWIKTREPNPWILQH